MGWREAGKFARQLKNWVARFQKICQLQQRAFSSFRGRSRSYFRTVHNLHYSMRQKIQIRLRYDRRIVSLGRQSLVEPVNLFEYEALAQAKMLPAFWDFYQGGSDDEVTLRANRAAFEHIRLRPRVLVDVSTLDTRTSLLGTPVSMPILVAPTALHCLAHPEGECATAQGAGMANTLMVASTTSTRSLEEIAQAASGPLWFQLYVYPNLQVAEKLVQRAETAGYRAIVLTVDLPPLGNREKDKHNNVTVPPPPFYEANFVGVEKMGDRWGRLTWESSSWLRSITSLPILLKGILTAEDALLAVKHGIAGIIVSNHGCRQLDTAIARIGSPP